MSTVRDNAPFPFAITVGAGKANAQGKYFRVAGTVADVAEALRAQPDGVEQWFSLHLWNRNYRTGDNWLASSGVVVDVDYDIAKSSPPQSLVNALLSLATDNDLPGSLFYLTPHGCRVIWVYERPCSDRDLQINAERGAAALLKRVIPKGYHIDGATVADLARFYYTPNCTAKNAKRAAEVLVMGETLTNPVDLAAYAGSYVAEVSPDEEDHTPISSDLKKAVSKWNEDHAQEWPKSGDTCPMCGHHECFGRLPKAPERWFCWSANHDGPGITTDDGRGHHGDALDLEAHKRGISPAAVLRADGYLETKKKETGAPTSAAPPVATFRTAAEVLRSDEFKRPRTTTPTGIADLDHLIGGGFKSRQLIVFAAPTGKGKTGLVGSIAFILSCTPLPILWVTTELDDCEQAARFAAIAGRFHGTSNATPDDFLSHRLPAETAAAPLDDCPLCLVNLDDPDHDVLSQVFVEAAAVKARFGRMPIVVIDYLQVLAPEDPTQRRMSVSRVANRLRRIAQELDTTVVAISSVSRAYYGKKDKKVVVEEEAPEDPRDWIAASKESGDIEYACSVFGYLDTANDMNSLGESEARLIVAKSRAGVPGFVGLRFHGPSGLFVPASDSLATMKPAKRSKGPPDTDRVLERLIKLQHDPPSLSMLRTDVKGLRATSVDAAVRALIDQGRVEIKEHAYRNAAGSERVRKALVVVKKETI